MSENKQNKVHVRREQIRIAADLKVKMEAEATRLRLFEYQVADLMWDAYEAWLATNAMLKTQSTQSPTAPPGETVLLPVKNLITGEYAAIHSDVTSQAILDGIGILQEAGRDAEVDAILTLLRSLVGHVETRTSGGIPQDQVGPSGEDADQRFDDDASEFIEGLARSRTDGKRRKGGKRA